MDAEGIKSLLWILLWGGLFVLMMRYGCGAHMMGRHGHGSHGGRQNPGSGAARENKDPVCGMTVDQKRAAAAAVHDGTTYYFCSVSCRDEFEKAPEKYAGVSTQSGEEQSGHQRGGCGHG